MRDERLPRVGPSFFPGLIIVLIGVVLLLDRMGYVRAGNVFDYWPLLLVAIGLGKVVSSRHSGGQVSGIIIATIGIVIFCQRQGYISLDWSVIWPVILIVIGLSALAKAFMARADGLDPNSISQSVVSEWVVFGGSKMVNTSTDFRGGELLAVFGGYQLDLTRTQMAQDHAVLRLTAIFGGIEVVTPEDWMVVTKGVPIFGGFDDKTLHPKPRPDKQQKTLVVKGFAMFGGIEVKN